VASVAWISELKNTLSLPFYLLSILWYLRFTSGLRPSAFGFRTPTWYWLSLGAFVLALLSKTTTVMLPVVLLGCAWWRRGRPDWLRISPYFALALAFGLMSVGFQEHGAMAGVAVQSESFWGRLAGAGTAIWFYLGKALLPLHLNMIYPRWQIDAAAPGSYLPLLLWCAVLVVCWGLRRNWGRHVLFGLGCFTVTLFPVLGFFNMYFLALSRVSDHFVYLPLTALAALAAAGLDCVSRGRVLGGPRAVPARSTQHHARVLGKPQPSGAVGAAARTARGPVILRQSWVLGVTGSGLMASLAVLAMLLGLAVLAMLRAQVFVSEESLWRDTLAKNPAAWCAHANLGWICASQQKYDEAREHLAASLALKPDNAQAHSNLGRVLSLKGKFAEADGHFLAAVGLKPKDAEIRRSYASFLAEQERREEAVKQLRDLLQLKPDTEARVQLATLLYETGKPREAVAEYRQVLVARPDEPEALNNLAWLLATSPVSAMRDGAEAVRLAEQGCRLTGYTQAQSLGTLAAAYAEAGRFPEAVTMTQKAIELARAGGDTRFAAVNEQLLRLYRAGRPYHEPASTTSRPGTESRNRRVV
jgi:Flp pilus assembly protein TadD